MSRTSVAAECLACRRSGRKVGLLCLPCSEAIASVTLLPEQIVAARGEGAGAIHDALLDQWGRAHALAACTPIGRNVVAHGITISDASVSRRHARIARIDAGWSLLDTGSSNGTFVDHDFVTTHMLTYGDRVRFGSVGFYAVFDVERVERAADHAVRTSILPMRASSPTLQIIEPTGGGGGLVELAAARAQLSVTQLELVEILSRRMRDDAHLPPSVRGYVRSSELVGALSWDARDPDDTHVKHLVRRARRTMIRSGLGDLIESRHRFGYRLRVFPDGKPPEAQNP